MVEADSTTMLEFEKDFLNFGQIPCLKEDSIKPEEYISSTVCDDELVGLPVYINDDPRIWFSKLESLFSLNSVTSDDYKFNTVVASLDSNVLRKVREAVTNPPATEKYENLKKMLLEKYDEETFLPKKSGDLFIKKAKLAGKIMKLITEDSELQEELNEFGEEFQKLWKRNNRRIRFHKIRHSPKTLKCCYHMKQNRYNKVKPCCIKRK